MNPKQVQTNRQVITSKAHILPWNTEKALYVYRTVFMDDPVYPGKGDPREQDIVDEMNRVKTAPSVADAAEIIKWWGHDDNVTKSAVKRIRRFKA